MNNEITITDLFEVEMLQRLQDSFSKMTGFAAIITDAEEFLSQKERTSQIFAANTLEIHQSGAYAANSVTSMAQNYP